jgi:hypothetical protein
MDGVHPAGELKVLSHECGSVSSGFISAHQWLTSYAEFRMSVVVPSEAV